MKAVKVFIALILAVLAFDKIYSQDTCDLPGYLFLDPVPGGGYGDGEIAIWNQTYYQFLQGGTERVDSIRIVVYPVGFFFNGKNPFNVGNYYSPHSSNPPNPENDMIVGKDTIIRKSTNGGYTNRFLINFDFNSGENSGFSLGYGKYKIDFYRTYYNSSVGKYEWEFANYVYIDLRYLTTHPTIPGTGGSGIDFRIDYFNKDTITFQHDMHLAVDSSRYSKKFWNINLVNKNIVKWEFYGSCVDPIVPNKGEFFTDEEYVEWPINAKKYNNNIGHENPGKIGMNLKVDHNISTHDTLIDSITNINISSNCYLMLENGKLFNIITPTVGSHNNLIIEDSAYLIVRPFAKINVFSPNKITLKNKGNLVLNLNSEIVIDTGAQFCNEGGYIYGAGKITYKGIHYMCSSVADLVAKDSAKFVLSDSATVELPDNFTLKISGIKSSLIMGSHSKIIFGENSKILIDSGATLIANNASFISADTSETWEGIVLNNSGVDSIINCTFTYAKTSLSIINDANHSNINRIIKGNTFNIPSGEVCRGIYGENNYRLLLQNNIFNMPVASSLTPYLALIGLYLKNSSTGGAAGEPEETEVGPYTLNIVGNTFNNGCASAILANYLSNLLPYNIKHNTFNYASSVNLIGMQIEGRIKNNTFTSDEVPIGIHLISSNPDLYNNSIEAKEIGIHMTGNCYPRMAPYVSGSDQVWVGGVNTITTTECDNIQLESAGNIFTDWGNNSFNLLEDSTYHIYGFVDSSMHAFYTRDNCWNSTGTPALSLTKNNSQWIVPTVYYNAWLDCLYSPNITGYNVVNLGNGVVDSVRLTTDYTSYEPSEEEILLYTSQSYMGNQDYPNAIATLKALIDTDTSFAFIAIAVDDLYGCYNALDTNDQNHRNDLFIDLIYFLETKILSEEYPTEFNEAAYDVLLMSYAKLGEYESTMEGYGMLAIYHPDPNIRLSASWNYAELEDLIELGEGGGFVGDINNSEEREAYESEMISKLNKKINDNPLSKVIKRSFDKMNEEKKTKTENELKSAQSKSEKSLIIRNKEIDNQKEERAKRNMLFSKNMTKLESEKRRMEDLSITIMNTRKLSAGNSLGNIVPLEYKLLQNYPNPFNPVTRIDFQLPKDVNVKIKVYDVSGREIQTLVNEFKQAGSYNISFDGSNLSSGVYFYRIEAGDFVQTKRMVLLK